MRKLPQSRKLSSEMSSSEASTDWGAQTEKEKQAVGKQKQQEEEEEEEEAVFHPTVCTFSFSLRGGAIIFISGWRYLRRALTKQPKCMQCTKSFQLESNVKQIVVIFALVHKFYMPPFTKLIARGRERDTTQPETPTYTCGKDTG